MLRRWVLSVAAILLVVLPTLFSLQPHTAYATNTPQEDYRRRMQAYLVDCLENHLDTSHDTTTFPMLFSSGIQGADYMRELIVVGLDIEPTNGVMSCREVMNQAILAIEPGLTTEAQRERYFINKLSGGTRNDLTQVISKNTIKDGRDAWVSQLKASITSLGQPQKVFTQLRLAGLLNICYDIKESGDNPNAQDVANAPIDNNRDFEKDINGKHYVFYFRDNLDDDSIRFLTQGSGIKDDYVKLGDQNLGFRSGGDGGFASGDWTPFDSDFYPFGKDFEIGGPSGVIPLGYHNLGVLDCNFIFARQDIMVDAPNNIFKVDVINDSIAYGLDKNGDGVISEDEVIANASAVIGGKTEEPKLTCDLKLLNPLTWLACPIIEAADKAITQFDNAINAELDVNVDKYLNEDSSAGPGQGYYKAWSAMRNIALSFLVIIVLIMVISQAMSIGVFDAYTIRKVMPRLVVSVIFITVSWPLMKLMIELSNDVGHAVRSLIYLPIVGTGGVNSSIKLGDFGENAIGIGAIGMGLGFGILGLLSFAVTGLAAVLIGLIVLVFRKILILLLVIMSPIAIISYILPNTQKVWKFWWSNFSKALLLFPIISAFIAAGRVFAATADKADSGMLAQVVIFIAYFGPYFALPATIRLAGGLVATIGGIANDRQRGFFDRNKKFRQAQQAKNWHDIRSGNRFKGTSKVGDWTNRRLRTASNINEAGINPLKMRERLKMGLSNKSYDEAAEAREKNSDVRAIMGNEDYQEAGRRARGKFVTRADGHEVNAQGQLINDRVDAATGAILERGFGGQRVSRDGSETAANAYLKARGYNDNAVALVRRAKRAVSQEAFDIVAATGIAGTGTGYAGGIGELYEAVNDAAGDDRELASRILADTRGLAERSRRPDLVASGFGTSRRAMEDLHQGVVREAYTDPTTGAVIAAGTRVTAADITARQDRETLRTQDPRTIISAKPAMIRRLAPAMQEEINAAYNSGNPDDLDRTLAKYAALYDQMASTSPESAQVMAQTVMSYQPIMAGPPVTRVNPATGREEVVPLRDPNTRTVRAQIEDARRRPPDAVTGRQAFLEHRREYNTAWEAGANRPPETGAEG